MAAFGHYDPAPFAIVLGGTALAILTLAPFWLGIYPSPLVSLIRLTVLQVGNG